jgi:hypothetical protein
MCVFVKSDEVPSEMGSNIFAQSYAKIYIIKHIKHLSAA